MFVFAVITFCSACTYDSLISVDRIEIPRRGFVMGMLPIPSEEMSFEQAYVKVSKYSEFVPVWGRPTPFYSMAKELSGNWGNIFIEKYTKNNGLTPIIHLSFYGEGMTLKTGDGNKDFSLSSDGWRNEYKKSALDVVRIAKPNYLSLGNEVNRWYEEYGMENNSPNGFQHYVSLYEEIYDAVKSISPKTIVFCTFSREIVSKNKEADLSVIKLFNPQKMDMLIFTSYPYSIQGINRPEDIPCDYYSKASDLMPGKPFGFSELAWPSIEEFGGEKAQAEFIYHASSSLTRSRGVNLKMFGWTWLCDLNEKDSTGLIKRDGTEKKAYQVWKNLFVSNDSIYGIRLRETSIPEGKIKMKPENDLFPPVLNCEEYYNPIPLEWPVNTAGAEDSPFISPDGKDLYFFFTPDVKVPVERQIADGITSGIWHSALVDGEWTQPQSILFCDEGSLDGCVYVNGNVMWFASVRKGNYGDIDLYTAERVYGKWTDVKNAGEQLNLEYDMGEFHFTIDFSEMYCGGPQKWGDYKGKDIYVLKKTESGWSAPEPIPGLVNTEKYNEDQPYITPDGNELWFTGQSRKGKPGPSVFRSRKTTDGSWGEPFEVISSFAGEPTLDNKGNIYFVHHYFTENMEMIEADIYVAYKKQ
jgi:hypothetical protein